MNETLVPLAVKSNTSEQPSKSVPVRASAASEGSPGVPLFVLASVVSAPAAAVALPVVSTIPLLIGNVVPPPNSVPGLTLKVPLATPAQVRTGADILMPGPAIVAAKVAADIPGVTVNCANKLGANSREERSASAYLPAIDLKVCITDF